MVLRFEDYVEKSRETKTVAELGQLFVQTVASEGYENCVLTSLRGRKLGRIAWAEIPGGYYDAYMHHRWDRIDPVVACSLRAIRPFLWSDVVEKTILSEAQIAFMDQCKELKVHSGIVYPFHGPEHHLDIISLSRRLTDPPNQERSSFLHAISVQTWNHFLEISGEQLFIDHGDSHLTERELEVLRWCKDGKTRNDISEILKISSKTVEYHLSKIMDKLGASNKISAVVIAIQRGIIEL